MNKQVCLVISLLVYAYSTLVHAAPPVAVPAPTIKTHPFTKVIGVTDVSFSGDEGRRKLNRACDDRFPGSHWCTSREVMTGYDGQLIYPTASVSAWVQPSNRGLTVYLDDPDFGNVFVYLDASGYQNDVGDSDCEGWTTPVQNGLAMFLSTGRMGLWQCSEAIPATCCALVSVPLVSVP
jgi:hypothetical protein